MGQLEWRQGDHEHIPRPRPWVRATAISEDVRDYQVREAPEGQTFYLSYRGLTVTRTPLPTVERCKALAQAIEDAIAEAEATP